MQEYQTLFLKTVAMKAGDKETMEADITIIQNGKVSKEEREAAEERVMVEVKLTGELFIHGDVATCEGNLRRHSTTAFKRFQFIKAARSCTLHLLMNKTIADMQARMLVERSVEDTLSLANFRVDAGLNITSNEDDIKNSYEYHSQAIEMIGSMIIIAAFKEFIKTHDEPVAKTKLSSETMIVRFLDEFRFQYYCKLPREPDGEMGPPLQPFFDDMEENLVVLGSRMLITKMIKMAEKNGYAKGLRAMKLVMVPIFLNSKKTQNSKYAYSLLNEHIDYIGLSPRDQARLDRWCTINTSGETLLFTK